MLGRVGAFLLLALVAVPYAPTPVVEDAQAGAFDALVRTFEYQGISRQERPLVLTQDEAYDRYYFGYDAEEPVPLGPNEIWGDPDEQPVGAGYVQVKRFGTSDVLCEGVIYEISHKTRYRVCDGLVPETHYVVVYTNTYRAELQMWGKNESVWGY